MYKRSYLKILLISILVIGNFTFLNASSDSTKFYYAKKNYVASILHNNKQKEIKYLKELVRYGTKLNKNVRKYKNELYRLDKSIKFIEVSPKKSVKYKKTYKKYTPSKKYSIKSVYVEKNSIIINFNKKVSKKDIKFFESKKKNNYYDTFDIVGNFKDAKPTKLKISNVKRIKIFQYRYKTLRISLLHNYNLKTYYIINNKQIIIKVFPKKIKQKNKKLIPTKYVKFKSQNKNLNNKKVIVIDAGHGGKDSGAVGPRRRYEKVVVLNIAKNLYNNLKSRGFKVYLTRNKDRYVSLRYRTRLANKKNADMFISVHANAARKKRAKAAHGVETYFLSPARSNRAKRVAALENKGDMNSMSYSSKNILLTLLNRSKITSSQKMAIDIQSHMLYKLRNYYGKSKILDGGVREGPFWVLVGAQMPSILIEVGYISHPIESKRIYTNKYQKLIASGIADGVESYFEKNK